MKNDMKKKYLRYIFPSMLSFLLTGIYSIVDGIFIGKAMGDMGLAAINIAWPLVAVFFALSTGIGMGGAVNMSFHYGSGDPDKAQKAEGNTLILLFAGALLAALILFFFDAPLLKLLGAQGELLPHALTYLRYILLGSIVQAYATGMIPLMRNHGASVYTMCSMAAGCVCNILLDYLLILIWNLGLMGAALATVLGEALTLLFCLYFYRKKENRIDRHSFLPDAKMVLSILKVAISPFGLTYLPSITIILMNLQSIRYGGEAAVSAYAVLAYIISFMEIMVQGIGDGSQPLLSYSVGSKDRKSLKIYSRWTFQLAICIGIAGGLCFFLLRRIVPSFYGTGPQAGAYIVWAAPFFALVMVFYGLTKPAISYFYATRQVIRSGLLVYGEVILTVLCILILPLWFGINGVWYTIPFVQLILTICSIGFLLFEKKQLSE